MDDSEKLRALILALQEEWSRGKYASAYGYAECPPIERAMESVGLPFRNPEIEARVKAEKTERDRVDEEKTLKYRREVLGEDL